MTGYVQLYTGNGKGKTTAAFGLALRAAGAGLRVLIVQFAKKGPYSEHAALRRFEDLITVRTAGLGEFITGTPSEDEIRAARAGFEEARRDLLSGRFDLVILDEICIANHFRLIPVEDVLDLIAAKPAAVELVLTGRNADARIVEKADLVTEMREVKHYYEKGVEARTGIEQ
jgi:cob(I)alamin adenosyltransferase